MDSSALNDERYLNSLALGDGIRAASFYNFSAATSKLLTKLCHSLFLSRWRNPMVEIYGLAFFAGVGLWNSIE